MRKSTRIAAAASGAILLVAANAAAAAADSPERESLTFDPTVVEVGEEVIISGENCFDSERDPASGTEEGPGEVQVYFDGLLVDEFLAEDDGTWSAVFEAFEEWKVDVTATCDAYENVFDYEPAILEIVDPEEPSTPPAPAPLTGSIVNIDRDGCEVTISTDTNEAGDFRIEVWDDGQEIDKVEWTQDEAGSNDAVWTITQPAMEGAPGVGFVFHGAEGGPTPLDHVDPYEYPAEVANECAGITPEAEVVSTSGPGSPMPATGADLSSQTTALIIAGVLVSAGAAMVVVRRVRTSSNG